VLRLVEATDGGLLVVGVTYQLDTPRPSPDIACPECGSRHIEELGPADQHVPPIQRSYASLLQCHECGSAWDN
jgi:DNA-directed RNA polymerase subunit RPC12/RpoP